MPNRGGKVTEKGLNILTLLWPSEKEAKGPFKASEDYSRRKYYEYQKRTSRG